MKVHPVSRLIATLLGVTGAFVANNIEVLSLGSFCLFTLVIVNKKIFLYFLKFIFAVVLPVGGALILVWGVIVGAPPGYPAGQAPVLGAQYSVKIVLRLILLGGICQLCFLTIKQEDYFPILSALGLKGKGLVVALACFGLIPELKLRSEQIMVSRYSRGLVADRNYFTSICQVPFILIPLVGWLLRSSLQRSDLWTEHDFYRYVEIKKIKYSTGKSLLALFLSVLWLCIVIIFRVLH